MDALAAAGYFVLLASLRGGILGRLLPFDDELHFGALARALATHEGFRLPLESDVATRYPIGFPALLALGYGLAGDPERAVDAWEIGVGFCAAAFVWLSYLALTRLWGFSGAAAGLAATIVALSPVSLTIGSTVMSDFPGALLALAGLCLADAATRAAAGPASRPGGRLAIALAVLGGAMAIRTAGVLAVVAAAWCCWRRGARRWAIGFAASIPVLVAGIAATERLAGGHPGGYLADAATQLLHSSDEYPALWWPGLVLRSGGLLLAHGLPGALLPLPFLHDALALSGQLPGLVELPRDPSFSAVRLVSGLALAAWALGAAWAGRVRAERLVPGTFAALVLLAVWVWTAPFALLGWHLQVRLALPALPFLIACAAEPLLAAGGRWSWAAKACVAAVLVVDIATAALFALPYHAVASYLRAHRGEIGRVSAYIRSAGPAGAIYPLQGYFYSGIRFEPVSFRDAEFRQARARGVGTILVQPHSALDGTGGIDPIRTANALAASRPPRASLAVTTRLGWAILEMDPALVARRRK